MTVDLISHSEKVVKYEDLVAGCRCNEWKTIFFAVEVGARGYVGESTRSCLTKLGLKGALVKKICKQLSDTALRWSFWVWIGKDKEKFFAGKSDRSVLKLNQLDLEVSEGGDRAESTDDAATDFQIGMLRKEAEERMVVKSRESHGGFVGCGLRNLGNSCYMNAVIQCMAVVDECKTSATRGEDPEKFVIEYENLCRKLWSGKEKVVTPSRFKRAVSKMDDRFNNSYPQDAQEFLSFILNSLKERRVGDEKSIEEKSAGQMRSTMCCAECSYTSPGVSEFFSYLSIQLSHSPHQLLIDCLEAYLAEEEIPVTDEGEGW